ncbi:MAG: DUF3048 domain-containing protein [Caldilinea sp. CFX5]|nr:DUF3048 domain-containing protein [Caldilinea sp. CFX5]
MTTSKKLGLFLLWCAALLTVLGCNLLVPMPEPAPTAAVMTQPPTATPTRPVERQTPLATLLRELVPTPQPTPTPPATPTPQPTIPPAARVNADLVNLRGGPGTNYAIVGQVRTGDQINIVGRNEASDWWRVCCPLGENAESWVNAQFVDLPLAADQSAAIPLATIPTPPEPVVQAAGGGSAGPRSSGGSGGGAGAGLPGAGGFGPASGNPLTGQGGGRPGQRPIIVCINNDYAARPQPGLSQADVLYEYLMEGYGITRFSAIFYGEESAQIGPVRSARLINYYMGALYDAGLACSGASDQVRYSLKHEAPFPYMDIDLDDPSNTRYSVSIGSDYRTRLRTSTGGLRRWLGEWGVEKAPNVRSFTFGGAPGGGAPANSITIPYPAGTGSQVAYRYDGGSGRYLRFMGGAAHTDGNTGGQLAVENVIVQIVPHEATNIVEDSLGSTSIRLNLFGSGGAIVFRDGQAFAGSWRSDSRGDLPRFFDQSGNEVPLKPGKSWISVVPPSYTVSYQ